MMYSAFHLERSFAAWERRETFGYDDPYLPRGGGHRERRVAYQAELGLEHQGYRGYQPRREPEQGGIGKSTVKIPSFDGKVDPYAYLEWEVKIEQIWNYHHFREDKRVQLAVSEFTGYALVWWDTLNKALMRNRFVPQFYSCSEL